VRTDEESGERTEEFVHAPIYRIDLLERDVSASDPALIADHGKRESCGTQPIELRLCIRNGLDAIRIAVERHVDDDRLVTIEEHCFYREGHHARFHKQNEDPVRRTRDLSATTVDASLMSAFTLVGFALRVPLLSRALWSAEGSTYNVIDVHSLEDVLRRVWATELTPPFYYLIEFLWTRFAGTSEAAMRAPSLLFSVATIPVMYLLGRRVAGLTGAIVCAVCATVAPLAVELGAEARVYALATFLAALFLYAYASLLANPPRRVPWLCLLTVSGALLVVTYTTGVIVVGIVATSTILRAALLRDRASWALAASSIVAAAAFFATLPFTLHFQAIWRGCCTQYPPLRARIDDHLNSLSIFGVMQPQTNALLEVAVLGWLVTAPYRKRDLVDVLIAVSVCIVGFGIGAGIAKDLPVGRHLLVYAPAFWLLPALLCIRIVRWLRRVPRMRWIVAIPVAYVLISSLAFYPRTYRSLVRPVSEVRDAIAALAPFHCAPLLVVAAPDYLGPTLYYYLPRDPSVVLRGITTWKDPQFYPFHPRPWYEPDFTNAQAARIERLARSRHALIALFADPHPLDYNGVPFSRVRNVVALLRRRNPVIFQRLFPGTRESVDLIVMR
jgi:hypothetical protein